MIIHTAFNGKKYRVDLSIPLDISLPLKAGEENPECYYAPPVQFQTIRSGSFIGSVKEGGNVNYQTLQITPHGNGTHTECYGHITASGATINQSLNKFLFTAELISLSPTELANGDKILTLESMRNARQFAGSDAIIVRTLPNSETKRTKKYSGTNPPYFEPKALGWIAEQHIDHFICDLPSVDKEDDQGKLLAHKAFWNLPHGPIRKSATITELAYIANRISDGLYLLNLQIAPLETDATPSKPIIYKMMQEI